MADVTSYLKRLTDLANSILIDLQSLKDLKIIKDTNYPYDFLNGLENVTILQQQDISMYTVNDTVNHELLDRVRYHLEGTLLTTIGILGIFGNIYIHT